MNKASVAFWNRGFSDLLTPLPLEYRIGPYSWSVFGGPKTAEIYANGKDIYLWELTKYARRPVEILSGKGDKVWWGFINEINIKMGKWTIIVSMETLANYIGVVYEDDADSGSAKKTSWAEATDSTAEYGRKELLLTSSSSNQAFAEAGRDKYLAEKKYPMPMISPGVGITNGATLYCKGWIETLAYRYYAETGTDQVDTATQISAIATNCGEFITGVDVDNTSGINTAETRDGLANGLFEINELLKMGTSNNRRLLCEVTSGRRLRIYEEPTVPLLKYKILNDGNLLDPYDTEVRKETCPVGMWAEYKNILPLSMDTTILMDPRLIFVDECEYDPETEKITPIPRGFIDPFTIGRPNDG
jgi:hypothetical protein